MRGDGQVSPYCRDSGSGWNVKWATRRFWAASSPPGRRKPCSRAAQRSPHHRRSAPAAPSRSSPPARAAAAAAIPGSQAPQPTPPAGRAELPDGLPHWAAPRGGPVKETNRRWKIGGGDEDAVCDLEAGTDGSHTKAPGPWPLETWSPGCEGTPESAARRAVSHAATGRVLIPVSFSRLPFP